MFFDQLSRFQHADAVRHHAHDREVADVWCGDEARAAIRGYMDAIANRGGRAANFLEIGGDAYTKAHLDDINTRIDRALDAQYVIGG